MDAMGLDIDVRRYANDVMFLEVEFKLLVVHDVEHG
jgi:hypothetical protein